MGSLLLSPGFWCTQGFFCALQESVSLVLWKLCYPIPLAFKFPWGSQSLCWIPRLGNLLWALELLQQYENFLDIIVLQFVGCLLGVSMVGLTYHASQVCYSQNPCPCSRSQLTHTSSGDTQTPKKQVWLSLLQGLCVLVHTGFCFSPPSVSSGGCGVRF